VKLFGVDVQPEFLDLLELAQSNIPAHRNGRRVYERFVRPAVVDLVKVVAHYAMSSLFEAYAGQASIYCYRVERRTYHNCTTGGMRLAIGQARVTSTITAFGIFRLYMDRHCTTDTTGSDEQACSKPRWSV
jgi:Domain of unknown function (DUF3536)